MGKGTMPRTVTIANGENVSDSFSLREKMAFLVRIPANFDGCLALQIKGNDGNWDYQKDNGYDGTTAHQYVCIEEPAGNWPASRAWYAFPFQSYAGCMVRLATITSKTDSTPVNQASDMELQIIQKGA